ncbi:MULTISPECIES: glycosyltransferase family 39 protein [Petrotoga]|uniref:Dolichyl-phosphate-mannose-protein mannosyltransferase n=2 Tax=Petrotoga sibirica TaxID=156202 RepID=A0A4R8ENK0_9BACT|nr:MULTISPECIES: glycosyltransferase family 39 protein [Petrotoga]PNR88797.1 hypothetical protein X925_05080 [Petrotoga sp. 9T1HF07.CasAA.8.2]POZ88396.1 hypothetical protein AA80_06380 [Petrotoga sibirica DSM 13575]TDX12108.1 dolichyl-phosphate-mannose-protein mannosyltransferase [Petrotoga sibirica]
MIAAKSKENIAENLLMVLLITILGMVILSFPIEEGIGFVSFLGILIITLIIGAKNPSIKVALLIAFIVRFTLALIQFYAFPLPDSTADAVTFERVAWDMASQGNLIQTFTFGARFYSWIISIFYSLFGVRSPLFMQSLNVLLGILIVFNVYKITKIIYNDERVSSIAALIASLYPTLALYSAITLREAFFTYFASAGIIFFVKWLKENNISTFLLAIILFLLSSLFHTAGFFLIISAFLVLLFEVFKFLKKMKLPVRRITLVFFGIIVIVFMITSGVGTDKIIGFLISEDPAEALITTQIAYQRGRTAFPAFLIQDSLIGTILVLPIRFLYFVFSPFIWDISAAADIVGLIDALILIILFWNIFKFKRYDQNKDVVKIMTFFLILTLLTTSLGVNNVGAAIRHRTKFVPIIISLASYNLFYNSKVFRFIRSIFIT